MFIVYKYVFGALQNLGRDRVFQRAYVGCDTHVAQSLCMLAVKCSGAALALAIYVFPRACN